MTAITEQSLESEIREVFQKMESALRGYRIILFGSRARGNAAPTSDFDVGVLGEQPLDLQTFYEIADALEALPTLYRIDWVDLNRANDKLRRQALNDGKVLYAG
jgi:predicted nucleotidyltransferase